MRRILVLAVLIATTLPLAACNTMEGLGKDMESAGRGIQDTF